jgi:alpha-1,2-mannosyltransferase
LRTPERTVVAVVCVVLVGSCAGAALGSVVAQLLGIDALAPAFAGTLVGIATGLTVRRRLAEQLPTELDGWFQRRRKLRWLWAASAVFAIVNTVRIGLFIADPSQLWASAFPPVADSAEHQCLGAYVRAGELAAQGHDDLWNPTDYAKPQPTTIVGLARYLDDTYEYPPPFAMVPRVAVAATSDYQLLRDLWFGICAVGFLIAFIAIAAWMKGPAGATALLLLPSLLLSFPLLFGLQWGQAHLLVVAASITAMMQFARGRTISGAALLAFAITTKIFPGLLLVHLVVRRQWRAIAITLGIAALMTLLATLVLGTGPLAAFVTEQLPRVMSGEAFAFAEQNPDNVSIYGIAFKLNTLGLDTGRGLASVLAWLWTALAIVLTLRGSRGNPERARDVMVWLAIICLATLRSPFAPIYTSIGTLWLLAVAVEVRGWSRALVAIAWVLLQGSPPMPSPVASVIATLPTQAIAIAVAVIAIWPQRKSGSAAARA